MAFGDRQGGKYFTIMGGKFCMRVSSDTPGAVARVNKVGNTVHEIFHDSFTAKLVNIRTRDSDYGRQWEFDFRDGAEVYTLQLSYNNSLATTFLKILPGVDLTKEMKLQPSQKEVEGKKKSSLFVSQDGKTLKHAYTREVPNGLPDLEEITVSGVKQLDSTKRLAFLEEMVDTQILPKLPKDTAPVAQESNMDAGVDDAFGSSATGGAEDDNDF